jgi:transcriptional regulator with XRE-family HTH domain
MSPDRFKTGRAALGLTQNALAFALGVSRRQIIRYETGEQPISKTISILIEILTTRKIPKTIPKRSFEK